MTLSSARAPRSVVSPDVIAKLTQIVGPNNAITDPAEQQGYLVEQRGLYRGNTPLVLRPGSVAEVAAILRLANETKTPIVPQGGNTGLVGGQVPHSGEVLLSLRRLDRSRDVQHDDMRGRRCAGQGAGGGGRRRSAVSALPRGRG